MNKYGLIGKSISYSFSPGFFSEKFQELGLEDHIYSIYELDTISAFPDLLQQESELRGLNVTIPYKEEIMPYLDEIDSVAAQIGAVNTICFREGKTIGFNTDAIGFEHSLQNQLLPSDTKALILGTGGAAKGIRFVLEQHNIGTTTVSRKSGAGVLTYEELNPKIILEHDLIINCTPLGTFPDVQAKPPIPYEAVTDKHFLFDLIYNPAKTAFLEAGEAAGARVSNGHEMLVSQAEASWALWQST